MCAKINSSYFINEHRTDRMYSEKAYYNLQKTRFRHYSSASIITVGCRVLFGVFSVSFRYFVVSFRFFSVQKQIDGDMPVECQHLSNVVLASLDQRRHVKSK